MTSDQKIIERIATEVMGLEVSYPNGKLLVRFPFIVPDMPEGGEAAQWVEWNPLEDWNDWRQVEERLMEDGKSPLIKEYLKGFEGKGDYMGSDLQERADVLIFALDFLLLK